VGGDVAIDKRLLDIVCCPSCRGDLRELPDDQGLECAGCRRVYPIVDGIPDLIVEDSRPPR
jgi:uncharacterized protein YbaR (Trm112 family)